MSFTLHHLTLDSSKVLKKSKLYPYHKHGREAIKIVWFCQLVDHTGISNAYLVTLRTSASKITNQRVCNKWKQACAQTTKQRAFVETYLCASLTALREEIQAESNSITRWLHINLYIGEEQGRNKRSWLIETNNHAFLLLGSDKWLIHNTGPTVVNRRSWLSVLTPTQSLSYLSFLLSRWLKYKYIRQLNTVNSAT